MQFTGFSNNIISISCRIVGILDLTHKNNQLIIIIIEDRHIVTHQHDINTTDLATNTFTSKSDTQVTIHPSNSTFTVALTVNK